MMPPILIAGIPQSVVAPRKTTAPTGPDTNWSREDAEKFKRILVAAGKSRSAAADIASRYTGHWLDE